MIRVFNWERWYSTLTFLPHIGSSNGITEGQGGYCCIWGMGQPAKHGVQWDLLVRNSHVEEGSKRPLIDGIHFVCQTSHSWSPGKGCVLGFWWQSQDKYNRSRHFALEIPAEFLCKWNDLDFPAMTAWEDKKKSLTIPTRISYFSLYFGSSKVSWYCARVFSW